MSGVVMNLSYTGPITAWNDFLSTSTISAPAALTVASDRKRAMKVLIDFAAPG